MSKRYILILSITSELGTKFISVKERIECEQYTCMKIKCFSYIGSDCQQKLLSAPNHRHFLDILDLMLQMVDVK